MTGEIPAPDLLHERQLCIDITVSGGNAGRLAEVAREDPHIEAKHARD